MLTSNFGEHFDRLDHVELIFANLLRYTKIRKNSRKFLPVQ